jgi:hypothetical protein
LYSAIEASETALGKQITGVETELGGRLTGLEGVLGTPATEDTPATGVFKAIDDAIEAGATESQAIRDVIGQPATAESEATGLYGQLAALGVDIGTIQGTLGTPATDTQPATGLYAALESGITGVETRLGKQITGVQTGLQTQINTVADFLGKPAQAVTQQDIDYVNSILQGTETTPDLTYDANRDGVIDQADLDILTGIYTRADGEPPEELPGTRWAPTGLYGEIAGLRGDLTGQLQRIQEEQIAREQAAAAEAEKQRQQQAQQAAQQQRRQQFASLLQQSGGLTPQMVQVKTPEVAKIGPLYDFSSIFRTPEQEQFFMSPFKYGMYEGGEVTEEELLNIVRG